MRSERSKTSQKLRQTVARVSHRQTGVIFSVLSCSRVVLHLVYAVCQTEKVDLFAFFGSINIDRMCQGMHRTVAVLEDGVPGTMTFEVCEMTGFHPTESSYVKSENTALVLIT